MTRAPYLRLFISGLAALWAGSLHAHVSIDPKATGQGPFRAAFRVPHGCEGSPTLLVRIRIPEGIIGVKPAPKACWTVSTVKGAYARTYDYFHGSKVSEGVKEIVWKGGPLPDEFFDEFLPVGFVTDAFKSGDAIAFPVEQECEKGSLAWTETATPGADPHGLNYPAPLLKIASKEPGQTVAAEKTTMRVTSAWARATPEAAKVAAAYLDIANGTSSADRLLSVSTDVAGRSEIHEMTHEDGVMKMRALAGGSMFPQGRRFLWFRAAVISC